jgi:Kef-type K+ transport system membrane component KefB
MSDDVAYVALLFTLFVAPRFLQRFGVPSALSALGFGAIAGLGLGVPASDTIIRLLATLGIVALFLFAGLDVEVSELRRERRILIEHVIVRLLLLVPTAWAASTLLAVEARTGVLIALALITPSAGFILDSLNAWGLSEKERFWIRSKAIATELVALAVLFVVLQSTSLLKLGLSSVALIAMIAVLPVVFRWFAAAVLPHAPRSEFGFLVMIATMCAMATRSLGVYYLVGAFVVGMAAQQFRTRLPALSSERMLHAVEAFGSLFVPFYFFRAGLELSPEAFSIQAVLVGLVCIVFVIPMRLLLVAGHRAIRFRERLSETIRIGVPMLPTTVFTLVLVEILRAQGAVAPYVLGGLIIYMLVNTLVPSMVLRKPAISFEDELLLEAKIIPAPGIGPDRASRLEPS